jgi:hypothetical protein
MDLLEELLEAHTELAARVKALEDKLAHYDIETNTIVPPQTGDPHANQTT